MDEVVRIVYHEQQSNNPFRIGTTPTGPDQHHEEREVTTPRITIPTGGIMRKSDQTVVRYGHIFHLHSKRA